MLKRVWILAAVLLAGCADVVSTWEKPGATQDEERAIVKKCQYEAEAHSEEGVQTESSRQTRVRKLRDMCLEANGMVLVKREVVPKR